MQLLAGQRFNPSFQVPTKHQIPACQGVFAEWANPLRCGTDHALLPIRTLDPTAVGDRTTLQAVAHHTSMPYDENIIIMQPTNIRVPGTY